MGDKEHQGPHQQGNHEPICEIECGKIRSGFCRSGRWADEQCSCQMMHLNPHDIWRTHKHAFGLGSWASCSTRCWRSAPRRGIDGRSGLRAPCECRRPGWDDSPRSACNCNMLSLNGNRSVGSESSPWPMSDCREKPQSALREH